ncbi:MULTISPECIES: hypothetical protein [Streptomyces]|uniref:Uncharacterized protein n=1 Tax=Streptomyces chartreusis NRRL 3882 TaxID=1079985 RepID=A0A2N9B2Z8_STRCX|nr:MULTISPECIES: hypothetical protein [Streptomyces]SOR77696.1 hypothetical protein SCNRRL3882_1166 [Streptomyces chartreusis NRRL 3882]
MRGHLKKAGAAADEDFGWRRAWSGSAAREGVWSNIRSAEVMLLQLVSDEEAAGRASDVMALVKDHLEADDPRRVRLGRRLRSIISGEISPSDRDLMVRALDAAYNALDDELARVRSLRNILWTATFLVLLGVAGLAVYGWFFPQSLSICFTPKVDPGGASGVTVVCPTAEHTDVSAGTPASELAESRDILTVEIAGLAGAALTVIASLRRIRGTDSPYMLPLASAVLKFPTGALSAFLGLLLIRGAFVPGLSDLDSRAQVLGWAAAFGAAQHLVTRLVDDRAQMTLAEVGRTTEAVVDPERAAVKESDVPGETGAPGPPAAFQDGEGPHEGAQEGTRARAPVDEGTEGARPRAGP